MNIENRVIRKYGLRKGVYDGAHGRRFVLFDSWYRDDGTVLRREFDNKRERDNEIRFLVARRSKI